MRKIYRYFLVGLMFLSGIQAHAAEILNVSYDPTRELYQEYNRMFAAHWKQRTGEDVTVKQSHGGSGKQARAVIDGLRADVVTLALAYDIDVIAQKTHSIPEDWQGKFPHRSVPYSSTIVFLVRKGNPKHIQDWADLLQEGVQVLLPNPKTSGGARWSYLAAYGYALRSQGNDETKARDVMKQLFAHVPVLDTGARAATTSFVQRGIGDVLITWENEAFLALEEIGKDAFEIVTPPLSIRADPPVAVVEKIAEKKGTLAVAREYIQFLYSKEAQELFAKHHYRPSDSNVAAAHAKAFPKLELLTIEELGGWKAVQQKHFDDGGIFDQIMKR